MIVIRAGFASRTAAFCSSRAALTSNKLSGMDAPEKYRKRRTSAAIRPIDEVNSRFDFETPRDRAGTGALKWDKYAGKDIIPMWVADMELFTAPVIQEALRKRIDHGIFGYTLPTAGVIEAVTKYYKVRGCCMLKEVLSSNTVRGAFCRCSSNGKKPAD